MDGVAVNFEFVVADWGTAGESEGYYGGSPHYGGTPLYASRDAFTSSTEKDLFAFGRIAMELFIPGKFIKFAEKLFSRFYL